MERLTILKTGRDLKEFVKNFHPEKENLINSEVFDNYANNGILITAEHAISTRLKSPQHGKQAYIGIGDANTAELTKLGAWHAKCAYIMPTFLRTELDLARPPDAENLILKVMPFMAENKSKESVQIPISTNKKLLHAADFYHKKINKFDPRFIMAYHGMHSNYKTDILLGFGPGRSYIGGTKNALAFKKLFVERLQQRLRETKIREDIIVKVSKELFTGEKNYTLFRHVKEYNETHNKKRFGIHVEFNRRGRKMKKFPSLPKLRYQAAAQVLAECAEEWVKKMNSK